MVNLDHLWISCDLVPVVLFIRRDHGYLVKGPIWYTIRDYVGVILIFLSFVRLFFRFVQDTDVTLLQSSVIVVRYGPDIDYKSRTVGLWSPGVKREGQSRR